MSAFIGLLLCVLIAQQSVVMGAEELSVIQANSVFSNKLYTELAKTNNGNIFYSPISAHTVLSMCYQGAEGETEKGFATGLGIATKEVAASGYQNILQRLNNVQNVTLELANKIYLKEGFKLQDNFAKSMKDHFASDVELIDFSKNAEAAKAINTWAEQKTNNKIKDLIQKDDLDDDTRLVLLNAIYFKGTWQTKFDPANTQKQPFWLNDNDKVDVDMMYVKAKFNYKFDQALDAQVLELPYANKDISMVIVLPNSKSGIAELEKKLASTDINKITEGLYENEVEVYLPKFKVETKMELNDPLKNIGLERAFSNSAEFGKMISGGEDLKISKVVQKAFIEVNEEGSEAAAVTAAIVGLAYSAIQNPRLPQIFRADHSFHYYLAATAEESPNYYTRPKKIAMFEGRYNKV